ncbi:MAG: DNA polymerase III subunit beta, partial [Desulfobacterales bacterium]
MKFKIKKDDVLDVLSKIQGLTGRKSNLAITTNVLISTTDTGIILVATDLETGFEGLYPAIVDDHGTIAINAKKFFEIVRDFPSDDINVIELEKHWIKIGNESVEYNIVGMNPEDFPEIPRIEDIELITIESSVFKKMIDQTVFITGASDEKRAHIVGTYFEIIHAENENFIRLVSTDGNRLSKVDHLFDKNIILPPPKGILIPKKGMHEVAKFLDYSGIVQIGFKDSNFIIKKESETIIIRLLEGDFPEYGGIIKKGESHTIQINKLLFLMMLKRMSILSSEDYKGVIFSFSDDRLFITTTNPDIGESKEDMTIEFTGDPIEVAFNP